ncbi:hypothetical protein UCMB321_0538 [Pseudomonas batumici]|uniref:Uncharacterized protein n=1 Tax=Pseudomonas batumici TaxID=226910 RepID=A0A0C2EI68_9PSED|nr:hypothetical protein UCMB321_0538 [Pseudomonas batumici]
MEKLGIIRCRGELANLSRQAAVSWCPSDRYRRQAGSYNDCG